MLLSFFVVGGLWFWVLTGILFISVLICDGKDEAGWAWGFILGYLVLIHVLGDANIFKLASVHPWTVFSVILGYMTAGVLWSIPKWYMFVQRIKDNVVSLKRSFLKDEEATLATPIPEEAMDSWHNTYSKHQLDIFPYSPTGRDFPPRPSQHKSRITSWMSLWPISIINTFFFDFMVRGWEWAQARLQTFYYNVSKRVVGEYNAAEFKM